MQHVRLLEKLNRSIILFLFSGQFKATTAHTVQLVSDYLSQLWWPPREYCLW